MKNFFKFLVIALTSLVMIYIIFIIEESVRLYNVKNAKPLIIVNQYSNNNSVTYESLGFYLTNKYGSQETEESDKTMCIGQELWLFEHFLIWGWIS